MDLYKKLMEPDFKPIPYYNGAINVYAGPEEDNPSVSSSDNEENSTEYAEEISQMECKRYATQTENVNTGDMENVGQVNDLMEGMPKMRLLHDYLDYKESTRKQKFLIDSYKDEILKFIKTNMVIIVHGPTGCGKSTQVPQFILDDCAKNKQYCNIVVTQPRKIAAISLARRVCEERSWSYGTYCGYQIGLERKLTADTQITYVTTGVLLNKIICAKNLNEYTHIIIDEVHERSQEMDFLFIIIRKFLYMNSSSVKIILMSATFDTDKFSYYFRTFFQSQEHRAPTILVDNVARQYSVEEYYYDTLLEDADIPDLDALYNAPKVYTTLFKDVVELLEEFDRVDLSESNESDVKNVLIFLPGIAEIEELYDKLRRSNSGESNSPKWMIVPLHSSISIEEQKRAFQVPPKGQRKIILSTNIAESSITVPDIKYVIDFCLTKALVVDPQTNYHHLQLVWTSRQSCIQRAGRVGRVSDGRVYRFVPTKFYREYMDEALTPEILRAPLESLILSSKMLDLPDAPQAILGLAIDPPKLSNVEYGIKILKEVGGLLRTCNGNLMKSDGDLTFLGRVMAQLPLDVKLSKLIVFGYMFNCLQECIIMAAGCSLSNIFTNPFMERIKTYTSKLLWADGSCSDLIALLHLYKVWMRHKATSSFSNKHAEIQWTKKHFVSYRSLLEWSFLVNEITDRLARMGIKDEGRPSCVLGAEGYTLLKIAICGAFYPHYFKRTLQIDEREAVKTLGGRDPYRTVFFKNMELDHPGMLYAAQIKRMFEVPIEDIKVDFDSTSKVYVEFLHDIKLDKQILLETRRTLRQRIPGKIFTHVYRAVKRRKCNLKHNLGILPKQEAWALAAELGLAKRDDDMCYTYSNRLKELEKEIVPLIICHVVDGGHFWAHVNNEETRLTNAQIEDLLNKRTCLQPLTSLPKIGDILAGYYEDTREYYRCKVESLVASEYNNQLAKIIFIDYGNKATININNLRLLPNSHLMSKPPQAIECKLAGIQPSGVLNHWGLWPKETLTVLSNLMNSNVYGKVFSVVQGIVNLELYKNFPQENSLSLNKYFVDKGFARECEESFLSKENNERRVEAIKSGTTLSHCFESVSILPDVHHPKLENCRKTIELKGPFSPLEMSIYNCMRDKSSRTISIEQSSVNCVLLDSEPQDPHERLIVAVQINETQNSNLSLRNTTIMPNIPGLPALMALLFCPMMEPKISTEGNCYAEILCGLGTYLNNRPVYHEHDISFTLDVKITHEDIEEINEIRYWMNAILGFLENNAGKIASQSNIQTMQTNLHKSLMTVLNKKRPSIKPEPIKGGDTWRKHEVVGEVLEPGENDNNSTNTKLVWPLHWSIALKNDKFCNKEIADNLEAIQLMATKTQPINEITCKMCNVQLHDVLSARIHLASAEHLENENKFK